MKQTIIATLAIILVAGCSMNYGRRTPFNWSDVYLDKKVSEDSFQVVVFGNQYDKQVRAKVEDFLLLRAAELTLDNGYGYFLFICSDVQRTRNQRNPNYIAYGTLKMVKEMEPGVNSKDARKVMEEIGEKYSIEFPSRNIN